METQIFLSTFQHESPQSQTEKWYYLARLPSLLISWMSLNTAVPAACAQWGFPYSQITQKFSAKQLAEES